MRYLEVAESIRSLIAAGEYGPGGVLPSEAELGRRFRASRVTVRKALDQLRDEGIVTSRRGSGWFVAADPLRVALGRFTTVEGALEAAGVEARREILDFAFEPASPAVARALALDDGATVLRVLRRNLADAVPFGLVTVWVLGQVGDRVTRHDAQTSTFYELLAGLGVRLGSATQSITAALASEEEAGRLDVRPGTPILLCRRLTHDIGGSPVLYSEHRYPAHRASFEVELPRVAPAGEGPVGLRLASGAAAAAS